MCVYIQKDNNTLQNPFTWNKSENFGRQRTARSEENIELVENILTQEIFLQEKIAWDYMLVKN